MGDQGPPGPVAVAPLRIGVVGVGAWGKLHALTLKRLRPEGIVLIALVDSDPVALEQASRLCPGVPTFDSIETALQASSAEAWVCATDTPSHVVVCKELLAKGRSVLCEQPLADEVAAAASLEMYVEAGAAGNGQGKLMVGHTGIFDPEFRALSSATANKGPLSLIACQEHLSASSLNPRPKPNSQSLTSPPDMFDATFSDWAAKLRVVVGRDKEPVIVRANAFKGHDAHYGVAGEASAEHLAMAQLLWDDGLVATIACDRLLPDGATPHSSLSVYGRGWCVSSGGACTSQAARGNVSAQLVADVVVPPPAQPLMLPVRDDGLGACGPMADQLRSFARFCRAQTFQPAEGCAFVDGLTVVRWLDRMRRAAADSHRALPVSLLSLTTFVHGADNQPVSWRDTGKVGRRQYLHRVYAAPVSRALPVTVLTAAESGPTVLLLAGLGGDEAEGMASLQHVLASVYVAQHDESAPINSSVVGMTPLDRGRIVAVNCCNLDGYDLGCGSRYAASDALDLGLSFPGMIEGSLTQRVAHTLTTEFIAHADFVATIHSGGDSGAFQIAPVAGFLQPPTALLDSPRADDVDGPAKLVSRRSQQQQTCTDCKMSAGVWAVERGSGTVQEAAEKLGIPSMFVAAAGALGGGAHGSNHDALGLAAAVTHILNSLHLIKSPQHTSQGTYGRFLSALEDSTDAPKLLGVLSDAYERKQAKFEEAAAEAKTKGDVPPLTPTVPMALRAAVPLPFGEGHGSIAATSKGLWRPRLHCGDVVSAGDELGCVVDLFGAVQEKVRAPESGLILVLRSKPRIDPGQLVALVVEH